MIRKAYIFLAMYTGFLSLDAQYITEVIEYTPAPGQFINADPWGHPESVSSIIGGIYGTLCLGAFGGEVVFRFDGPVENHPDNPFGVDFTIFGNPQAQWSEPGSVWVMKDENENGTADDTWYELAGSDYHFSTTKRDFSVTYKNPGGNEAKDVSWTAGDGRTGFIKANSAHIQAYYPETDLFPHIASDEYTVSGTLIEGAVDVDHPPILKSGNRAFGYADNLLRGVPPYTVPDNPYTPEIENSGGDAMDISWAVDGDGIYVELDEVHFVKVQSSILHEGGWLGEVSTEITGAVDVSPSPGMAGETSLVVVRDLPLLIETPSYQLEVVAFSEGRSLEGQGIHWSSSEDWATVDENHQLDIKGTGPLTLTASLEANPSIIHSVSTTIQQVTGTTDGRIEGDMRLYPNPAGVSFQITGIRHAWISIYDASGSLVRKKGSAESGEPIRVDDLQQGIYLVGVYKDDSVSWFKLFKQ